MNADDPRLTAYALGELSGEEAAAVAAAIERDPQLAAEVTAIQMMAGGLESALSAEALPETEPVEVAEHIEFPMGRREPKPFPYFWVGGLAAAGFAVLVMVQSPESPLVGRESTNVVQASRSRPTAQPTGPQGGMPELDKVSDEPAVFAEDLLLAEADYSEKDPFVIAVDPAPFPMPDAPVESAGPLTPPVASKQLALASAEERKRTEETKKDSERETILSSAGTIEATKAVVRVSNDQEVVDLSPFSVDASQDVGYSTITTLTGPRLGRDLRDVGAAISVSSTEFLNDTGNPPDHSAEGDAAIGTIAGSGSLQAPKTIQGHYFDRTTVNTGTLTLGGGRISERSAKASEGLYVTGDITSTSTTSMATVDGSIDFLGDPQSSIKVSSGSTIDINARIQNGRVRINLRDSASPIESIGGTLTLSGGNTYTGQTEVAHRIIRNPENIAGEDYAAIDDQGWQRVVDHPLSTFAVDVDSASYANVRRFLQGGNLPPMDAVKVEELVNAFSYKYAGPATGEDAPLMANLEVAAAPWAPEHRLVRIGLKAEEMPTSEREAANLVFLMDVSGSMRSPQKLPLVKEALRMLLGQLRDDDRVAIVTYAGSSGLALPSTPVAQRRAIESALGNLRSGGSTNGALGIHLAYDIAKTNFVPGGINRVILCTDGDFNVGTTGLGELGELITEKAKSDVFLTALGFGMGNYQDDTLEQLANKGNGHHGYIDSVREARRLLVEQVEGTLNTVARDVKIQVEFNPAQVAAYRLIGYDNRRLAPEEFNDDTIDAGEVGAGHTVTALYEVIPVGATVPGEATGVDSLRYQSPHGSEIKRDMVRGSSEEMLTVKLRAQPPEGGTSRKWEFYLQDSGHGFDRASPEFKFAAAVAGFGLVLRDHPSVASSSLAQVEGWARSGITDDPGGYRHEFLDLVSRANQLLAQ